MCLVSARTLKRVAMPQLVNAIAVERQVTLPACAL